jgi:hypothetical protein
MPARYHPKRRFGSAAKGKYNGISGRGNENPSGITPTIRVGVPSKSIVLPTTDAAPPKCDCQKP